MTNRRLRAWARALQDADEQLLDRVGIALAFIIIGLTGFLVGGMLLQ